MDQFLPLIGYFQQAKVRLNDVIPNGMQRRKCIFPTSRRFVGCKHKNTVDEEEVSEGDISFEELCCYFMR